MRRSLDQTPSLSGWAETLSHFNETAGALVDAMNRHAELSMHVGEALQRYRIALEGCRHDRAVRIARTLCDLRETPTPGRRTFVR